MSKNERVEKKNYKVEMNKLFRIESKMLFQESQSNLNISLHVKLSSHELIRKETADFPMKLVSRPLLNEETKN